MRLQGQFSGIFGDFPFNFGLIFGEHWRREMALSTLQQWFLGRRTSWYLAALCHVFTKSRRTVGGKQDLG